MAPEQIAAEIERLEPTEDQEDRAFSCESKYAAYRLGRDDMKALVLELVRKMGAEPPDSLPATIAGREYKIIEVHPGVWLISDGSLSQPKYLRCDGRWDDYCVSFGVPTRQDAIEFICELTKTTQV